MRQPCPGSSEPYFRLKSSAWSIWQLWAALQTRLLRPLRCYVLTGSAETTEFARAPQPICEFYWSLQSALETLFRFEVLVAAYFEKKRRFLRGAARVFRLA